MFTFGFYNSLGGDRKYNSVQISRLFEGIINDGVFASIGDSLMVTDGAGGMTVNVGTGRAWFNNTWNDNDAIIPMTIDASEAVLNRIDAIVLEVQDASDVRTNSIKKIKGTPASVPVPPTMINMTGHHQYPLALVAVNAGATEITAANITNKVGTTACPFATVVGLDALLPVWENEFDTWFSALQAQMAGDVATNLQNQITANLNLINAIKTKYATCSTTGSTTSKIATQAEFSLVTGVIIACKFTYANTASNPTLNVNGTGAKAIQCCGAAAGPNKINANMLALLQYDGTYWQLLNPADNAINQLLTSAAATFLGVTNAEDALLEQRRRSMLGNLTLFKINTKDGASGTAQVGYNISITGVNAPTVTQYVTNTDGYIYLLLPYGSYTLKFLDPIIGYDLTDIVFSSTALEPYKDVGPIFRRSTVKQFTMGVSKTYKKASYIETIDAFIVGGGATGGAAFATANSNGGGGGGGYTRTQLAINVAAYTEFAPTIGGGGSGWCVAGGATTFLGYTANGGNPGSDGGSGGGGGSGGSGGGGSHTTTSAGGAGGSDGSNGVAGLVAGGAGQGTTTREFGEAGATLYSGGGGGAEGGAGGAGGGGTAGNAAATSGANGSFYGAGGGGACGGSAGSRNGGSGYNGCVVIRWA